MPIFTHTSTIHIQETLVVEKCDYRCTFMRSPHLIPFIVHCISCGIIGIWTGVENWYFLLHLYGLHCSILPNTVAKKVTIRNFHIYFLDKSLVKVPKTNLFCFILLYCLWSKFLFYLFIWLFNVLHFVHNKQCFEQATGLFNPIYGVSLCM